MVKKIIITFILSFSLFPLFSEVDIDPTLQGIISGDIDGTTSGVALGSLSIKSTGDNNVKSELLLDFTSSRNISTFSITKAYIKFRYPLFRVTIGKTRITWGDGVAFNAGDVIFDDYVTPNGDTEELDLTADELKTLNRTMVQITYPIGRFTFLEGLYLPYDFFPTDITTGSTNYDDLGVEKQSFGGRFRSQVAGIKVETGYIYNGFDEVHKPYISFNGTLLLDYHLSSSVNIPNGSINLDDWKESLKISSGLFYLFNLDNEKTVTTRLESQIEPFSNSDNDMLQIYPEIILIPNNEISLFSRSIISPFKSDLESTLGLNWKTYQGFTIGLFISTETTFTIAVTHKF